MTEYAGKMRMKSFYFKDEQLVGLGNSQILLITPICTITVMHRGYFCHVYFILIEKKYLVQYVLHVTSFTH